MKNNAIRYFLIIGIWSSLLLFLHLKLDSILDNIPSPYTDSEITDIVNNKPIIKLGNHTSNILRERDSLQHIVDSLLKNNR